MNLNPKVFQLILTALAAAPGIIAHVNETIHGGATKKEKALELTSTGLSVLDQFAPSVRQDPKFLEAVGKANDAIYFAAKLGAELAAAK